MYVLPGSKNHNGVPNVSASYVRDLGCEQVQGYEVGEALDVAHAQVCEEATVQVEVGQTGQG